MAETVLVAVVRVRHFPGAVLTKHIQEARQYQTLAGDARARVERPQIGQVAVVHGQDVIEVAEVLGAHLARAQIVHRVAALRGGGAGASIRRAADVPVAGAGACDMKAVAQAGVTDPLAEHRFGGGRTADIAQANEQNRQ